jgi:hypothetical protein
MTDIGAINHPPAPKPARLAQGDFGLLVAWWFVIACYITAFDLVSARAAYVPLYASVVDHVWQDMLWTGLIGALCAERHKLLWCLVSALGGLAALAVMVIAITLVSGLLAA